MTTNGEYANKKESNMTALTHAQIINGRYLNSTSNFVSLQQRLNEALKHAPLFQAMIDGMADEFKRRHKEWTSFKHLEL